MQRVLSMEVPEILLLIGAIYWGQDHKRSLWFAQARYAGYPIQEWRLAISFLPCSLPHIHPA
jgi:hypothetical protein